MKKVFKIISISLASLVVILILVISIALWFVFTPEKITPLVQQQTNDYLTCTSEIDKVELTFFSTYPNFALKINHIVLVNPTPGAPSDTLIAIKELVAIVDFAAWWKRDEIKVKEVILSEGTVNVFYDSLGHSNLDIFPPDTTQITQDADTSAFEVDIENVRFENINLSYIDNNMPMKAILTGITGNMNGKLQSDILLTKLQLNDGSISLEYDGEKYLQNVSSKLDLTFKYWLSVFKMDIENASGKLNDLPIQVKGIFLEDPITKDLVFDLAFNLTSSPVEELLKMVPPSYTSYFDGITVSGMLAVDGTMIGNMNATDMPLFNIHLLLDNGKLKYEGVPLAFHRVSGDVTVVTDAMTDSKTFLKINNMEAQTDSSSFAVKGLVNHLFTDVYCNLVTNANLTLGEFNQMIPAELKMSVNGKATGQIKSSFTLTQLEKMQFDKIKLSGKVNLTNFDAKQDSLWVYTDRAVVDFALPNSNVDSKNTGFVFANMEMENLRAGAIDSYTAYLGKSIIAIETSNVMDTTRIPDVICSFSIDSLAGSMDTISLAVGRPEGKMILSPRVGYPMQPQIQLTCSTAVMVAHMGKDIASMKQLNLDVDVINDNEQKDVFLQWLVKGFMNMDQGHIALSGLSVPLEIPSIKMNFDPENFNIIESMLNINKSDFQLSGNLKNILSYFRGDSILRGNFKFTSNNTDVNQLMALTSGIGYEESKPDSILADTSYTGPYMVPKGMDITLSTNIKQATFGTTTATNIKGDVLVHDGLLVLDDLRLTTPATRIQLTAIYRTPRKNHLYLGLDYHMFNIEIEKLLEMVPDIDSLMPMLRSFSGKGEFHMAAETYLDSMYNLKKSTLRGAASITGQNLVLLDGETFSEIAKSLKFNKKTVNKVDSLTAEFTVFKNEIDVYPFLIVMDKYKAIVAGRHNLDMSFDYHISVVECPLPIKLGVDVKGTLDNLSYKLAKCQYADYYRPVSRHTVANKQLELRNMIRNSLLEKVKEE